MKFFQIFLSSFILSKISFFELFQSNFISIVIFSTIFFFDSHFVLLIDLSFPFEPTSAYVACAKKIVFVF